MLSPRYLQGLGDELADIYSQLETDILRDMARRIARLGRISDATKWQAEMLAEAGGLQGNIQKILKKYDAKIARQVEAVYREALEKNTAADNRIFKDATGRTVSDSNAQQMLATIQKAHSDLSRLTLTTAATSQELFVQQANRAFMDVQSGAFDYNTSMKHAADELSARGITTVQYENGKPVVRTIESAVRMNILTGINQTASTMTLNNCEELGCDLVETSAHIGARPSHEAWQGRIFSLSGTSDKYPSFDQCGYGTADGICGINCRHSFYPFFEGTDRHYTQDDLDELSKETVTYKDNQYTRYEGEQQLRKIERTIRQYKRRALTQEAAGVDNTAARIKIGEWQAAARDFTQQTGIQRDRAREYIGTKDGKQPRAVTATQATSPRASTRITLETEDLKKNLQEAEKVRRLDRSIKKEVAGVKASKPMNFTNADGGRPNPNFDIDEAYQNNCQSCVVTYELRRRGYNLETMPHNPGSMTDVLGRDTRLAWIDRETGELPEFIVPNQKTCKAVYNWLKTDGNIKEKNRYTIEFAWKNSRDGHIITLYKANGIVSLYDPQDGSLYKGSAAEVYLQGIRPRTVLLLDVQKCDINLSVADKITRRTK